MFDELVTFGWIQVRLLRGKRLGLPSFIPAQMVLGNSTFNHAVMIVQYNDPEAEKHQSDISNLGHQKIPAHPNHRNPSQIGIRSRSPRGCLACVFCCYHCFGVGYVLPWQSCVVWLWRLL